jgi:hypothetical protein
MPCNRKTKQRIMASVRNRYPAYGLARRKRIVSAIVYRRKK